MKSSDLDKVVNHLRDLERLNDCDLVKIETSNGKGVWFRKGDKDDLPGVQRVLWDCVLGLRQIYRDELKRLGVTDLPKGCVWRTAKSTVKNNSSQENKEVSNGTTTNGEG